MFVQRKVDRNIFLLLWMTPDNTSCFCAIPELLLDSLIDAEPVVSIQGVSIRPQALKLLKNFDHFKYSLHGHKNIWGEYSSYFKPSTWNCLHLDWINFYRDDLFRSDFVLKRPLTMDACFNFVVSSRRSESEDED